MIIQLISLFIGLAIAGATIFIVIKERKSISKIDAIPNAPLFELDKDRTKFTDGYARGILKSYIPCKNGCVRIEFFPIDIEQGENRKRPEMKTIILGENNVKRLARTDLSSRREIIKAVGRMPTGISEKMKGTPEANWETAEGQKAWLIDTFGTGIKAGDEAIAEAMIEYARGQISKLTLAQIKEINKKFREGKLPEIPEPTEKK